ncbi:MAG: hypothetical protein IIA92_05160 [Chloroflexi bacterium]|nr:hypothetical protein [Chloroflexota bacterium]
MFETVVAKAAGISAGSPLAGVLSGRSDVLELTEKSHDAALRPRQPGGLTHSERAALACRIAKLNSEPVLARHYKSLIGGGNRAIADTVFDGGEDTRLKAILRHTDLVTVNPKEAIDGDISALRSAGLDDADIVRLSELIAFVSYQIRVAAGLRLMAEVS